MGWGLSPVPGAGTGAGALPGAAHEGKAYGHCQAVGHAGPGRWGASVPNIGQQVTANSLRYARASLRLSAAPEARR